VGGDLFDFVKINSNLLGIVIGDVSGKGIPAALFMARLISDFRYYSHLAKKPAELLHMLNSALLKRSQQGMFVTLIYMVLNMQTGELTISNAGHLPLLWRRYELNHVQKLDRFSGIPLGILPSADFNELQIQLQSGDFVLLFTDGITEAKNHLNEMFSLNRLLQVCQQPTQQPQVLIENIVNQVKIFQGPVSQHDDITLLAVRWQ
ncbi:MAG: PP2C family protein-serine/threonine phosphatase, partial [bacterium]|nr:PP2C family protein-serine/threonine phosphatase [bacterium]